MPKRKQKPIEQRSAEDYLATNKPRLNYTTEKQVKGPIVEEILEGSVEKIATDKTKEIESIKTKTEKTYSKPDRKSLETVIEKGKEVPKKKYSRKTKKKSSKKSGRTSLKTQIFEPKKISLNPNGYELIITEKPQAAMKIASALGKATKKDYNKIPYYNVHREGKEIYVACAVGHLFTLSQNVTGSNVPIFDISWKPNYMVRKADFTKKYYDTISKLAKDAGSITVATDFDVEGEVIGMNVVRYLCGQKDANRMKFSTLTEKELNDAYENKSKTLSWGQGIAGETRHYLDWFYGINLSRALMNAIKSTGKFKIMSIGRVQGPSLKLIVEKEKEIQAFKPETYWQIFITVDDKKNQLELKHVKDIFDKNLLKNFENLIGKTAIAQTKKTEQIVQPNPPFNLTTLQTEIYKFHGISPAKTLQAAQSLYLAGLISYPRTSSQKLPASIGYKEILKKIAKEWKVEHLIKREKPIEGKKTDPAHPSIYPTGNSQILSGDEEKVYNLIVKRFLSLFCEDAIIDNKTVKATVNNLEFSTRGTAIRKKGFLEIYPSKLKENEIPDMEGEVRIIDSRTEEKETQPPKRYSPASILSLLEKKNLGTKATRSAILETLYDRGYVTGQNSIEATALGISLIETLEKYSPIIIDENLTRKFEKEMESMQEMKKDIETKEKEVIEEAKEKIIGIAKDFEKNENKIGQELVKANVEHLEQQKKENTLISCPKCGHGNLFINYSKKFRKQFVACDAYPECKNTMSLPPNGIIKKANKVCEQCNFPLLIRLSKGKRPWIFCFNPECLSNKERIEDYRKKQEESSE